MNVSVLSRVARLAPEAWVLQPASPWLMFTARTALAPQGWKLHLSAHLGSFDALIDAAVPVLAAHGVNAKVIGSREDLEVMNDGRFGLTQVGKVMTVYPADTDEAVALAIELDRATRHIDGPAVPCERRLGAGSSVYYRYGSFDGRTQPNPMGGTMSLITDTAGNDVEDDRTVPVPAWLTDPFVDAGVAVVVEPSSVLAGRYALLGTHAWTARGRIHPALDLVEVAPCTAKRAAAWGTVDAHGRDARDRLRREADLLNRCAGTVPVPRVRDLVQDGDDLVLIIDEMPGRPLHRFVTDTRLAGSSIDGPTVRALVTRLATGVAAAHDAGVIVRDISPGNVIVSDDGAVHLIDLEIAHHVDDPAPPIERLTIGFGAPSSAFADETSVPTIADDVFAIGAALWLLLTGRDPGLEPGLGALTRHRLELAAPEADADLVDLTLACLARDPGARPASARAVVAALEHTPAAAAGQRVLASTSRVTGTAMTPERDADALARATGALVADIEAQVLEGNPYPTLGSGLAGLVLAAATVGELLDDATCLDAAERGAELLDKVNSDVLRVPGLFVGLAGIAATLVHPRLRTDERVSHAIELVTTADRLVMPTFDLINGAAGVARAMHLVALVADDASLTAALESRCEELAAERDWALTSDVGATGGAFVGYAHGVFGVADVLIEHGWHDAALEIVTPLLTAATTSDGRATVWPNKVGGAPDAPVWCRGAGGVGIVLEKLSLRESADACWDAVAGARWSGPTRCHGLAGQIELLLDVERFDDASVLGALLAPYAPPALTANARRVWLPADLLDGNAGVAVALARLTRPHEPTWMQRIFGTAAAEGSPEVCLQFGGRIPSVGSG